MQEVVIRCTMDSWLLGLAEISVTIFIGRFGLLNKK